MKKMLAALLAVALMMLGLTGTASAQDEEPVIGTVESDPPAVPAAGEYTVTATGAGFIPESTILLGSCISPADTLVPGVSTVEEITAAAGAIDALADCDLTTALTIETDADGAFEAEVTAEIGDNFFLSAGTITGAPQAGAVWIPIVDPAAAQLAVTGVESSHLALLGTALVLFGALAVQVSRRRATI